MLVTAALTLGLVILVGSWLTRPQWVALDTQPADPQESSDLLDMLRANGKEVKIEQRTGRFQVLAKDKAEIQAELAPAIFTNGPVGMEIIEQGGIGGTRGQEETRRLRGLQGEIEKLLNSYKSVLASKVLLSVQRNELFKEDRVEPAASVFLKLKPGVELTTREGERMARQVAGAVVGLKTEQVQILDEHMQVLHTASEKEEEGVGTGLAKLQRDWEHYHQRKVEQLLYRMLGHGRSTVSIGVQLDHAQRSVVAREIDPEKVVTISSKATEQTSEGIAITEGVAGTAANLDGAEPANAAPSTSASTETVRSDVPETRKTDVTDAGAVMAITASVVIDGHRVPAAALEGDEATEEATSTALVYEARTEAELADFTLLVRNALGPAATEVTVQSHEFKVLDLEPLEESALRTLAMANADGIVRYSAAFLLLLFAYGLVLRPMVQSVTRVEGEDDDALDAVAVTDPLLNSPDAKDAEFDVQGWLDRFSSGEQYISRSDVSRLVLADIDHSVVTLQEWLTEGDEA
jgi:flagellar M-ring protein FliF